AQNYIIAKPEDVAHTAFVKIAVDLLGLKLEEPLWSARNLVAELSNLMLLVLAAIGVNMLPFSAQRPQLQLWRSIAASSLLAYVGLSVIGPVGLRYRISLEPVLWICAAGCLMHVGAHFLPGSAKKEARRVEHKRESSGAYRDSIYRS